MAPRVAPRDGVILVVDDNPDVRELVSRALRAHASHPVSAVGNGSLAIDALRAGRVAAVVADHSLGPGPTGVDVLAVSAREQPSALRILITGSSDIHVGAAAINEARVDALLTKPFRLSQLLVFFVPAPAPDDDLPELRRQRAAVRVMLGLGRISPTTFAELDQELRARIAERERAALAP